MDPAGITAIIAVSLAGVTALSQTLCHQMAQSRCVKLTCGCIECIRDPLDKEELEIVTSKDNSK
jgi:hypothetical protein